MNGDYLCPFLSPAFAIQGGWSAICEPEVSKRVLGRSGGDLPKRNSGQHRSWTHSGLPPRTSSHPALSQRVQILDKGAHRPIDPGNPCIGGIDQIVLIRGMCPGPVPRSKMSGGKIERFGSEDVSRPGAGRSRPQHRIQTQFAVSRNLRLDELRIR